MAKFLRGIHGAYTGKVGNVVGSSWRNVDYVKSLPKQRSTKATPAQLAQQENSHWRFLSFRRSKIYSIWVIPITCWANRPGIIRHFSMHYPMQLAASILISKWIIALWSFRAGR